MEVGRERRKTQGMMRYEVRLLEIILNVEKKIVTSDEEVLKSFVLAFGKSDINSGGNLLSS